MVKDRAISRRYSLALFELALEDDTLDRTMEELSLIGQVFEEVPKLSQILSDDRIAIGTRSSILDLLLGKVSVGDHINKTLHLLFERNRLALLIHIIDDFKMRYLNVKKIADIEVVAADGEGILDLERKIEDILESELKMKVKCKTTVDQTLIGGFLLRMGDYRYDASVIGKLMRMKEKMCEGN